MSSGKYVDYYIELITNTMQDAIIRNVSLQTNARITDEVINEQAKKIEELEKLVGIVNEKDNTIRDLRNEVSELLQFRNQYENIKHQVNHLETFRNELIKEREEHEKTKKNYEAKLNELNEKNNPKLTPTKRKKVVSEKLNNIIVDETKQNTLEKDGGTF